MDEVLRGTVHFYGLKGKESETAMRITKHLLLLLAVISLGITSCTEEELEQATVEIPENFSIDIPDAISNGTGGLSSRTAGDGDGIIEGEEIYAALPHFIRLGEASAEIVEASLFVGAILETLNIRSYTLDEGDDGRAKRFDISENVVRAGVPYQYEMTLIDVEDNELALQVLWNTNPVVGVGILRPYYIDRIENEDIEGFVRINYSEDDPIYDATMTVAISGVETVEESDPDNLKMFVGKSGDVVDVFGNSNHPTMTLVDPNYTGGRNYAFVGRGDETQNLGVVKLALPPSNVETADVLETYSVYNVLEEEIDAVIELDQSVKDAILAEAGAPAYFDGSGFISAGASVPDGFSASFIDLEGMNPFVPTQVRDLTISFLE